MLPACSATIDGVRKMPTPTMVPTISPIVSCRLSAGRGAASAPPVSTSMVLIEQARCPRPAPGGVRGRQQRPQAGRRDRHLADGDAEVGDRVLDRVGDGGGAGDGAALADALDAERIDGRAVLVERDGNRRQVVGARNARSP